MERHAILQLMEVLFMAAISQILPSSAHIFSVFVHPQFCSVTTTTEKHFLSAANSQHYDFHTWF